MTIAIRTALIMLAAGLAAAQTGGSAWDELVSALNKKDYALALKLVEAKPELAKTTNADGWSALHVAAKQQQTDSELRLKLIGLLLDKGADPNLKLPRDAHDLWTGKTPLHLAASSDAYEAARLLIERGADPAAADGMGVTPLHTAAFYGNKPLAELLLAKKVPVDAKNTFGATPLHDAVEQDQRAVALLLLDKGADINARDAHGVSLLHVAAIKDSTSMARLLLDRKIDPNARDSSGKTPLGWAEPPPADQEDDEFMFGAKVNPEMVALIKRYGGVK